MTTSPVAAQSSCPTQTDLQLGLELIDQHGNTRRFFQRADGLYEYVSNAPEGWVNPHPLVPGQRASAAGSLTIEYASDPTYLDTLAEGAEWISEVTYLKDGISVATGTASVYNSGLSPFPIILGSCQYNTMSYRVTLDMEGRFTEEMNGSAKLSDDLYFAPKLGLVVGATILDGDGVPSGNWSFTQIARLRN